MLYGQWLAGAKDDVQAIVLPRRDPATDRVEGNQSSYAAQVPFAPFRRRPRSACCAPFRREPGRCWRREKRRRGGVAPGCQLHRSRRRRQRHLARDQHGLFVVVGAARTYTATSSISAMASANPTAPITPCLTPSSVNALRGRAVHARARLRPRLGCRSNSRRCSTCIQISITNLDDGGKYLQLRGVYDWQQDVQLMAGVQSAVRQSRDGIWRYARDGHSMSFGSAGSRCI